LDTFLVGDFLSYSMANNSGSSKWNHLTCHKFLSQLRTTTNYGKHTVVPLAGSVITTNTNFVEKLKYGYTRNN
jgi:hypothetical protein